MDEDHYSDHCSNEDSRRKASKPAMEKRRRARINASLLELKSLLLQAMKDEGCRHSKMEKADILEMAVKHLRQLQRQQFAMAAAMNPAVVSKYRLGYNECANEVTRYLGNVEGVSVETRARLLRHLTTCLGENTRTRLPRMESLVKSNMAASVLPVPANVQPTVTQTIQVDANNNNNNSGNGIPASSVLQPAKLVNADGTEMTVLIGLPNTTQRQVQGGTTQMTMTSQPLCVINVPIASQSKNCGVKVQKVEMPPMQALTSSISTSNLSQLDGHDKMRCDVGNVWPENNSCWRPWQLQNNAFTYK